jgi:hypothetical protein
METTRIILTDVLCRQGKRTKFTLKESGKMVAVVNRKEGKYVVFAGWPFFEEVGTRTSKDSALRLAKESVLKFIPDAEFKLSVVQERIR